MTKYEFLTISLLYGLKLQRIVYKYEKIKDLSAYDLCPDGEIDNILPILYPLSDLVKQIEYNGQKFIFVDKIWHEFNLHNNFDFIELITDEANINDLCSIMPFDCIMFLIKLHFDIAGLIERGEAIDVNTLKVNPYA
jgi:hypothetical protein